MIHSLFPSIVIDDVCQDFSAVQPELIDWIYWYRGKNPDSVHISNRGGWQSPAYFHNEESFQPFLKYILGNFQNMTACYKTKMKLLNMWININRKGDYNTEHDHPVSDLSGVLWIKTPKDCGALVFPSPKSFVQHKIIDVLDEEIRNQTKCAYSTMFHPEEGKMVIFPSDMRHSVEMNNSDEDRISIAFNMEFCD